MSFAHLLDILVTLSNRSSKQGKGGHIDVVPEKTEKNAKRVS